MIALPAPSSSKAYWLAQSLGWGLYLAVNLLFTLPYQRNLAMALVETWMAVSGAALTHLWHKWIRRRDWLQDGRPSDLPKLAVGALAVAVLQIGSAIVAYAVLHPPGTDFHNLGWIPVALTFWICVSAAWTALYAMGHTIRRARQAELHRLNADVAAKDAALQALKTQVNPHFFFNSLNSVRALVFIDAQAAARMIDQIAALMRYALDSQQSDTVPLAEELKIVRTYLAVEKTRFESRLQIEESIDPQLLDRAIPPMIVQTLVENAVKYGTANSADVTTLRLTVRAERERMVVEVVNSGHLATESCSTGLGLANVRQRIALLYGGQAELSLTECSAWVSATLRLPQIVL